MSRGRDGSNLMTHAYRGAETMNTWLRLGAFLGLILSALALTSTVWFIRGPMPNSWSNNGLGAVLLLPAIATFVWTCSLLYMLVNDLARVILNYVDRKGLSKWQRCIMEAHLIRGATHEQALEWARKEPRWRMSKSLKTIGTTLAVVAFFALFGYGMITDDSTPCERAEAAAAYSDRGGVIHVCNQAEGDAERVNAKDKP